MLGSVSTHYDAVHALVRHFVPRLRDRLRGERNSPASSLAEDVAFAEEVDAMLSLDAIHRLKTRIDSFERRLSGVESRYRRRRPS